MGTIVTEKDGRYRVRIRRKVRGVLIEKSARFDRRTDAQKWDRQIESEITAGKFFKTVEAEQHTLNDVIERYEQHLGLENPRRLKTVTHLLDWWGVKLGHHLLADLTQAVIAKVMDDLRMETVPNRKKGLKYTNATVNRYKSALQSALNMAVSPWCWLEDNPVKKMKNLKEPPGRDRFLNKGELTALLNQCQISENPYLYGIQQGSIYETTTPGTPLPKQNWTMCLEVDEVGRCRRYTEPSEQCMSPQGMAAKNPTVPCSSIKR